jgi:hypothetical protein
MKESTKNQKYLDLSFFQREEKLTKTILSLPSGYYTTEKIAMEVGKRLGAFAETDVNQRLLIGIAVLNDRIFQTSFTLGLDEIHIGKRQ